METTADKLKYLRDTKAAIREAITDRGVDIGDDVPFRDYADKIREIPFEERYYGIEYDVTVSSPDVTRIGNMNLHRYLPVQNRMRGCLLDDDGSVVEYLNPANWEEHVRDGSRGQVMVELPMYYRKFETEGDMRRVKMSEYPLPGYHQVKKRYIAAYEAALQHSTNKLCSVVNYSTDYRGGANKPEWDNTYRSALGRPKANLSRVDYRSYARNRNADTKEWNLVYYELLRDIFWLFVVEFATRDTQKAVDYAKDENGFSQGGLGLGVTTLPFEEWHPYNYNTAFVPCGYTDSLGNGTGEVAYNIVGENESLLHTVQVPRYRGIENLFGHLYTWTDGYIAQPNENERSIGAFVIDNPELFNETDISGYRYVGDIPYANDFVKEIHFGDNGDIVPSAVGGSSSTFFCDDYDVPNLHEERLYSMAFGGSTLNMDGTSGLCHALWENRGEGHDNSVGTRICFIPKE